MKKLIVVMLVILALACFWGRDDTDGEKNGAEISIETQESSQPSETAGTDYSEENYADEMLSVENLLFHRLYTELGTVQIHHFPERTEALRWMAEYLTKRETYDNLYSVELEKPLFKEQYYHISSSSTGLYYIGDVREERPDGFGAVIGLSTGQGTYDLAGAALFYYVGNFKGGMMDGYGITFAADEADITYACRDVIQIMQDYGKELSEDTGETITRYLFNYVSYEGYFKENEKEGKGNTFGFYWDEGVIRFVDMLNPPIDGYQLGPVYPNVTMGEYKNGELSGDVKIYKSNHIVYDGEMKDGTKTGEGTIYYDNGQIEYEGELSNGIPDGTGTYYDTDGTIIYSGKWKNGEYAH